MTTRVTVLSGGYGGARLADALRRLPDVALTFVVNVGDDLDHDGLRVSPDPDMVVHGLRGVFDEARGWGVVGEPLPAPRPGGPAFSLGAVDRALCERRTELLARGHSPAQALAHLTEDLTARGHRVLPVTDDEVRTEFLTADGWVSFHRHTVLDGGRPPALAVRHRGLAAARPAPGVLDALATADLTILGPSNPATSLGVVRGVDGIDEALRSRSSLVLAITPVVLGSRPPPPAARRARLRRHLTGLAGRRDHPADHAAALAGIADVFVVDVRDAPLMPEGTTPRLVALDTLAPPPRRRRLAEQLLSAGLAHRPLEAAGARPGARTVPQSREEQP